MTDNLAHPAKKQITRFLLIQIILVLVLSFIFLLMSKKMALSALAGGFICVLPSWIFARKFFATTGAQNAKQIIKAFYQGELTKIILTALLFFIAFKWLEINPIAFFSSFFLAQIAFWFAPLVLTTRRS